MKFSDNGLRLNLIQGAGKSKGLLPLPRTYLLPPGLARFFARLDFLWATGFSFRMKSNESFVGVRGNREIRRDVLANVRGIDVDVHYARVWCKGSELARHSI